MPWRDIDWKEIGAGAAVAVLLWRLLSWILFPRWVATVKVALAPELGQLATACSQLSRVEETARALVRIADAVTTLADRLGHVESYLEATSDFERRPVAPPPYMQPRSTGPL